MVAFTPPDPQFEARVRASFARQRVMETIGARLVRVEPGVAEIELAFRPDLTQQHGYLHAGVITTVVDSACGYAAFTLMPAETGVLTVEYKVNFLAPAAGDRFLARGRVLKPGRTLSICAGEVIASSAAGEKLIATMLATMMNLRDREGVVG